MSLKETIKNLPNNNRFYVLVFSFLLSIFVVCLQRALVVDDQLYSIQLEQVFGFLALAFLYASLVISPIKTIVGKPEWMKNIIFARRGIGVSALYFALLHASVNFWGQLGGFGGLGLLPNRFVWPLILGLFALIILCVMGLTSVDKMVIFLTFPGWKKLQRLVYLAGVCIIVHVWIIGAHFEHASMQWLGFTALAVLFALESWRIVVFLTERYHWNLVQRLLTFFVVCIVWVVGLALIAFSRPATAHMVLKDTLGGAGAILHITPDDDPVAGERTQFLFDIQATSPSNNEPSVAKLTITDSQGRTTNLPAVVGGDSVKADYVFPAQGLYMIMLDIDQRGKSTHQFMISQRVSRGILTEATASNLPLWAGVGVVSTGALAIVTAAVAFGRRRAIAEYSKL